MNLIDYIRNETGRLVWNSRKTYSGIETTIRKFQSKGMDHLLGYYKTRVIDENKNIIGHINSFKKASKIVAYLKSMKPDLHIRFYHGEDKMIEKNGLSEQYHKDMKLADL